MTNDEFITITNSIKALHEEVIFIEQQLFFESAQRKALGFYCIRLAEALGIDRRTMLDEITEITKKVYSDDMDMMEKHRPAMAAKVDIRQTMPEDKAFEWYLAWFPDTPPEAK